MDLCRENRVIHSAKPLQSRRVVHWWTSRTLAWELPAKSACCYGFVRTLPITACLIIVGAVGYTWHLAMASPHIEPVTPTILDSSNSTLPANTLTEYLAANLVTEMVLHVRDGHRVAPMMEHYYRSHPLPRLDPHEYKVLDHIFNPMVADGVHVFTILPNDSTETTSIPLVRDRLHSNGFLVDWEAAVFYSDETWPSFLSQHSEPSEPVTFRVYYGASDFYPLDFPEDIFLCIRLRHPVDAEVAYGYCRKDTAVATQISQALERVSRSDCLENNCNSQTSISPTLFTQQPGTATYRGIRCRRLDPDRG